MFFFLHGGGGGAGMRGRVISINSPDVHDIVQRYFSGNVGDGGRVFWRVRPGVLNFFQISVRR